MLQASNEQRLTMCVAITNLEQALSWLGATEDMDDGFIVAMYKVKV